MPKHQGERRQLCIELEAIKERVFRAGLYKTAQILDKATKQIGYECVEQFDRETKREGD